MLKCLRVLKRRCAKAKQFVSLAQTVDIKDEFFDWAQTNCDFLNKTLEPALIAEYHHLMLATMAFFKSSIPDLFFGPLCLEFLKYTIPLDASHEDAKKYNMVRPVAGQHRLQVLEKINTFKCQMGGSVLYMNFSTTASGASGAPSGPPSGVVSPLASPPGSAPPSGATTPTGATSGPPQTVSIAAAAAAALAASTALGDDPEEPDQAPKPKKKNVKKFDEVMNLKTDDSSRDKLWFDDAMAAVMGPLRSIAKAALDGRGLLAIF